MNIPDDYIRIQGSERRPAAGARLVGPANPNEILSVIIVLRRKQDPSPALKELVRTAPGKRNTVSRQDFAAQYGATQADMDRGINQNRNGKSKNS